MADTAQLQSIALDAIDCDIPNHRLLEDAERIAELARSIEAHGLQQPVRVYEKPDGRYILGFGFRRLAAHRQLERDTILAFVLPPADDQDIRAAQAIENLHRQDLHPLEEAEACSAIAQWANAQGNAADEAAEVAARIGRPRPWVEGRLALLRLSARVRQLLLDGKIYLGHAQLIARLVSHEKQEEIAGRVAAYEWKAYGGETHDRPPSSIADCRRFVEAEQRNLNDVNWRLDVHFAGKSACDVCPHNSANTLGLFDDAGAKKPQCLDAECFKDKTKAASNALRRAVNTLNKSENKPTVKNAEKAIAEREVEFVQPKAVAKAAKKSADPKKQTAGERSGRAQANDDYETQMKFHKAKREWEEERDRLLSAALQMSPRRCALFLLIAHTPAFHDAESDPWRKVDKKRTEEARAELTEYLELLREPELEAFGTIAGKVKPIWRDSETWPVSQENPPAAAYQALSEILCVSLPPAPKLKDFQPKKEPKVAKKKKAAA